MKYGAGSTSVKVKKFKLTPIIYYDYEKN